MERFRLLLQTASESDWVDVNRKFSVISFQFSVFNCEILVISFQLLISESSERLQLLKADY